MMCAASEALVHLKGVGFRNKVHVKDSRQGFPQKNGEGVSWKEAGLRSEALIALMTRETVLPEI